MKQMGRDIMYLWIYLGVKYLILDGNGLYNPSSFINSEGRHMTSRPIKGEAIWI